MTYLLFPDTTVVVNFALIHRMDLLKQFAGSVGRWCATVEYECLRLSSKSGHEDMADAGDIFGEPLYPKTQDERLEIESLRIDLAEPEDGPYKHLGEAETIVIIRTRGISAAFVTDDRSAREAARREGVKTYATWDLLKVLYKTKRISREELWTYVTYLRSKKRGWPASEHTRDGFVLWADS